jgi:hypothetical protein
MKCLAIKPLKFKTSKGVKELNRGDIFTIKNPEPIKDLIAESKILPLLEGKECQALLDKYYSEGIVDIAIKLYSPLLDSFLWITIKDTLKTAYNLKIVSPESNVKKRGDNRHE